MIVVAHLEVHLQRGEVEDRRELERQRVKHGPQFEVRVEDQEVDEPEDVYRLVFIFEGGKKTMRGDKLIIREHTQNDNTTCREFEKAKRDFRLSSNTCIRRLD